MADDVEGLEVPPELVQLKDGHGEEQAHVVAAVEGGRDRVDVQLFSELERVALERQVVRIDLGAQAAVPLEALQGVPETVRNEVTIRRIDLGILQAGNDPAVQFGTQVIAYQHAPGGHVGLVAGFLEVAASLFQHPHA